MYRKEKKIPTLIALVLIFLALGGLIFFDRSFHNLTSKANTEEIPRDVRFTNITHASFTVSWLTSVPTIGYLIVSGDSYSATLLDDLDTDNIPRKRTTHSVTVKNLKEKTRYKVQVLSGSTRCLKQALCPTFTQETGAKIPQSNKYSPVVGKIYHEKDRASIQTIVYLSVGKSALLSTRTDSAGNWVIPLNNLRSQDLSTPFEVKDEDLVQINAWEAFGQTTGALTDFSTLKQYSSLPPMTLGFSYNFTNLANKKEFLAQTENSFNQNILGSQTQDLTTTKNKIDILFPEKDGDVTPDNKPRLRGIGIPGKKILITINSTPQTAQVIVEKDGTWTFQPKKPLSAGVHYISIQSYDEKGKLVTIKRKFIVLKSGERVLGEATASASLTPSETATPTTVSQTHSPTISPTPTSTIITPTPSPTAIPPTTISPTSLPPRSGSSSVTFFTLGGSLTLLLLGITLLAF